ncbi:Protein KIAA0649 [Myotis brandtii]|uniref:Protein KIAA0649 n=1 Tax=Myotis brandtii TaxID=109478 RepID=S7N1E8_MYOBR|nr:Protein KIAA0649 [Myotis brandtii]
MEVSHGSRRGASSSLTKIYKATRVGGSGSDDRLEEVIQLYWLEKRKEVSRDPQQKTLPKEEQPGLPIHGTSHATKIALPQTPRKMPGKWKPLASKAVDHGLGGLEPDQPLSLRKKPKPL